MLYTSTVLLPCSCFFMWVLLYLVFWYVELQIYIFTASFLILIFWHERSKTTQGPELKYRLHREIMCALLLYFLPMVSSFCTSFFDRDCLCYKIFPTSEGYFRVHEFVGKARCFLPWASLDTGISSVTYHQVIEYLVTHFGHFSNEFHLILATAKTT